MFQKVVILIPETIRIFPGQAVKQFGLANGGDRQGRITEFFPALNNGGQGAGAEPLAIDGGVEKMGKHQFPNPLTDRGG